MFWPWSQWRFKYPPVNQGRYALPYSGSPRSLCFDCVWSCGPARHFPLLSQLLSVGALGSLTDQSPKPRLWSILRDPHPHQQHPCCLVLLPASEGGHLAGSFFHSVSATPSLQLYFSLTSLACWVPACRSILLLLLHISLSLVLWHFSSNSSFSACSCLKSVLFSILTLASSYLVSLFSVWHTPGAAAAVPSGSSFLLQSSCNEAAVVLQISSFCLSVPMDSPKYPRDFQDSGVPLTSHKGGCAAYASHTSREKKSSFITGFLGSFPLFKLQGTQPQQCCRVTTPVLSLPGFDYMSFPVPGCYVFGLRRSRRAFGINVSSQVEQFVSQPETLLKTRPAFCKEWISLIKVSEQICRNEKEGHSLS